MLTFDEATHTYYWNGVRAPSVTQRIARAGLLDDRWYDEYSRMRG
jgi:hypothetical protein